MAVPDPIHGWNCNNSTDDAFGSLPLNMTGATFVSPAPLGSHQITRDAVDDLIDVGDDDSLSFGDGVSDFPFSIHVILTPVDITRWRIFCKYSPFNKEYLFTFDGTDKLRLTLLDVNDADNIQRVSSSAYTSDEASTHQYICTYDGSGSHTGIKLYRDGVRISTVNASAGSYTAMHSSIAKATIGNLDSGADKSDGKTDAIYVWDEVLTDGGVAEGATAGGHIAELWNNGNFLELSSVGIINPYYYYALMRGEVL